MIDYSKFSQVASVIITKAMQEGIDAWKNGIGYCQNPYPLKTIEHDEWAESWDQCQAYEEYIEDANRNITKI